ncbi:MAG: cyclic nucleotide-binding domain-containing protein [Balneolia bacterium]|nr:cyclic nucleotide-binding domain-containing protein [Balneolia bacterium]
MTKKTGFFGRIKKQSSIVFNSRFLNNLSHLEAYEFIQLCHRRRYDKDEYIYHQNDPGNGFYILESGAVELIIESESSSDEEPAVPVTLLLESPQSFGNLSLSHEMKRMSSARATEDTVVLGFFSPDFATLEKRYPQIAIKVLGEINRVMAVQLESTIRELSKLSSLTDAYKLQFETFYTQEDDTLI